MALVPILNWLMLGELFYVLGGLLAGPVGLLHIKAKPACAAIGIIVIYVLLIPACLKLRGIRFVSFTLAIVLWITLGVIESVYEPNIP